MNDQPADGAEPVHSETSDWVLETAREFGFDHGVTREEFYENPTARERIVGEFARRAQAGLQAQVRNTPLPDNQLVGPALQSNESVAVAFECPKVAALSFDRVWGRRVPAAVSGYFGTPEEQLLKLSQYVASSGNASLFESSEDGGLRPFALVSATPMFIRGLARALGPTPPSIQLLAEEFLSRGMYSSGTVARLLSSLHGMTYTAVFDSETSRHAAYKRGSTSTVLAVLSQLELVDEAATTWDQVQEFRSDSEARKKYDRFVHWLDGDMVGKPASYIVEEVGMRLERYRWAIRKHGFKTTIGSIRMVLDKGTLVATTAAGVTAAVMAGDAWGVLASSGVVVGKVLLHVVEELLDLEDLKRTTNPELAYVHEAENALS